MVLCGGRRTVIHTFRNSEFSNNGHKFKAAVQWPQSDWENTEVREPGPTSSHGRKPVSTIDQRASVSGPSVLYGGTDG